MSNVVHAIDYLAAPEKHAAQPVCVLYGDEPFLKRHALERLREAVLGGEGDFSFCAFEGPDAQLRDVMDELGTVAMFGGQRLVLVDEADDFVTRYRSELEDYVARPKSSGVLVLSVGSWPSNTRLAKAVDATGLAIDCHAPNQRALAGWLVAWGKRGHRLQLAGPAAELLIEMIGPELGLLDQELAKLALVAGPGGKVAREAVAELVGTWRAKTAWQMLDAALDGKTREAIVELDRLLLAGEAPVALLAQIASPLRRLAAATRLILTAEATRRRITVRDALIEAGVRSFAMGETERRLRRLGRQRAGQLYDWLLEADLGLKGASELSPRMVLERLLLRLALPAAPQAARQ